MVGRGFSRIRGDRTLHPRRRGPLDYEPGHMRNAQKDALKPMGALPMTGAWAVPGRDVSRVQQIRTPRWAGNVSDYLREPEFTTMLAGIPTLWDDTRVLDGRIGDYIVTMRRGDGRSVLGGCDDGLECARSGSAAPVSTRGSVYRSDLGRTGPTPPELQAPTGSTCRSPSLRTARWRSISRPVESFVAKLVPTRQP